MFRRRIPRRRAVAGIGAAAVVICTAAAARSVWRAPSRIPHPRTGIPITVPGAVGDATLLFNGWKISPAGRHIRIGDMPLGGALSPDGALLAIPNCGYQRHGLQIVDVAAEKVVQRLDVARAWNGIAWSPDGRRIYLSGGVSNPKNDIYVFEKGAEGFAEAKGFTLTGSDPKRTAIAGLALSRDGSVLYALNNSDDHLYALSTTDGALKARIAAGDHPVACRTSADGKRLYVANWGGAEVALFDLSDTANPMLITRIPTGEHPNDIVLSHDSRAFISCGNSDAVSVIDTLTNRVIETVKTAPTPGSALGSTPNALALSPDARTLYAANADNNSVCVIDVSRRGESRIAGFIPTGWYPTALALNSDGTKLFIGSGKGLGTRPNPSKLPISPVVPSQFEYIGRQLGGLLSAVDAPTEEALDRYTRQVAANTPYRDEQLAAARAARISVIPTRVGAACPIKYVLYIIKENRTYDQVFGDMGKGNGDPNLCLFGREVTPNQHALAEQFVLLDNLYCSGEVSADGHPWSTSAYATDFIQRSWVLSYSGKGLTHRTDSVGDPRGGYIWDACARKGLSYRSYGEYVYATSSAAEPEQKVAGAKGLIGHGSPRYVGIGRPKGSPDMRDTEKADIFIEEFKKFERTGAIPRFMVMSLGEDHTRGTSPGAFTPKAMVASNDVAVGRIVDAISHSSAWKEFAIFIIEDDAQNGPDHVDSHRTTGLVISPYVRRGTVDSAMYSTASMLRTMELILGLPPMTQYDAGAPPMFASFMNRADLTPFSALPARIDITARNMATAYGARESARMDWSDYDRIDESTLNRILWKSIRGADSPVPAPVRSALPSRTRRGGGRETD